MPEEVRLKSPDIKQLRGICEAISDYLESENVDADDCTFELCNDDVVFVLEALQWIDQSLTKRRDYHRGHQTKQKTEFALLKEALKGRGVDPDTYLRQNRNRVADALIDDSAEEPVFPPRRRQEEQ